MYLGGFQCDNGTLGKKRGKDFFKLKKFRVLPFMEEAGAFDAGYSSSRFTWCNNHRGRARIWKQLDRLLIDGDCSCLYSLFSKTFV